MKPEKILIVGGSAGSLTVIMDILTAIRPELPFSFPVLIVLHRNVIYDSSLEDLLASRSKLPIKEVEEKEAAIPGQIYLSPADYHVLFESDRTFSLDYSERVHFSRPSIDVSFRSASDVYGPDLVCVLLSGGNADGAEGLQYVRERGGIAIVQDPRTAEVPYMPQQAILKGTIDFVLPTAELGAFILQAMKLPRKQGGASGRYR
jgi:two-component system chemotaxis response regulator CheB